MQRLIVTTLAISFCIVGQATAQRKPRKLAPGVVTVIPPNAEEADTFTEAKELVEIVRGYPELDWQPNSAPKNETLLERAKSTVFRRDVWYVEFGFKPLRMIQVNGQLVWYLTYYVKNNGNHLSPAAKADDLGNESYSIAKKSYPVTITPNLILRSFDRRAAYMDRVIPEAVARIRQREDAAINFHDSVSISQKPIPVSGPGEDGRVWAIATWTGIDPRTDFLSIYVQGLTNAYRWTDKPGAYKKGDAPGTGRKISQKTLKLNFWRPGDAIKQHEKEIRYGMPFYRSEASQSKVLKIYQQDKRSDHTWVYR